MPTKRLATSAIAVLLMAGCGGGNEVESLQELGALLEEQGIDCSGLRDVTEEMFVREHGDCGDDVNVYVFNDSENRDNYLEVARGFGGGLT